MIYKSISFSEKFGLFAEHWQPKVVAQMNEYQFKVVKLKGDFVWHQHQDTDETFIVVDGDLRIDFRDGAVHASCSAHSFSCCAIAGYSPLNGEAGYQADTLLLANVIREGTLRSVPKTL
jgi:hypothetical protein